MPIWLGKFTYQQIAEYKQEESDAIKKASSGGKTGKNFDLNNPTKPVPRRPITPNSYMKRASKK